MADQFSRAPWKVATVDLTSGLSALEDERAQLAPDPLDVLHGAQEAITESPQPQPMMGAPDDHMSALDALRERILAARQRLQGASQQRRTASSSALERLKALRSNVGRGLPWLQFAGAVLKPPKSGDPMESVGEALQALGGGLGALKGREHDIERLIAQAELGEAGQGLTDAYGVEKFDLEAMETEARLRAAQQRMKLAGKGPLEQQLYEWVNAAETPEEKAQRQAYVTAVRGTSQMKNADALTGGGEYGDTVANLLAMPEFRGFLTQAEKLFPEEAYQGVPVERRNRMIFQKALELMKSAKRGSGAFTPDGGMDAEIDEGAPVSRPPAVAPRRPPAPPQSAQRLPPPGAPTAAETSSGRLKLGVPGARPGVIPDEASEAARKKAAEKSVELEAERIKGAPQALQKVRDAITKTANLQGFIDKAIDQSGFWSTGLMGEKLDIAGLPARNLRETLKTIQANLGFDSLQAMRAASPTGGALGQVAVAELERLEAAVASLDKSQSDEQLTQNLEKIRQHYNKWRDTVVQAYKEQYPEKAGDIDSALERKSRFKIRRKGE